MKRRDLLRVIQRTAAKANLNAHVISGGNHDKVFIGKAFLVVPRHREINEFTARSIRDQAESIVRQQNEDREI